MCHGPKSLFAFFEVRDGHAPIEGGSVATFCTDSPCLLEKETTGGGSTSDLVKNDLKAMPV